MAGTDYDLILGVVLFLVTVWGMGRFFRLIKLPGILGELLAGILLGPEGFDVVPFASDGHCPELTETVGRRLETGNSSGSSSYGCRAILRFNDAHIGDIWSFIGTIGVTLLIMESGMHINFDKVRSVGGKALIVAIIGTSLPLVLGMVLTELLYPGKLYPEGFAAGCALAPTSVGISIKFLDDAKMLNSMAGQTTLTAAFVDDIFSLVLLVLLTSLGSAEGANAGNIVMYTFLAFGFLALGVILANKVFPHLTKLYDRFPTSKAASIQMADEVQLFTMLGSLVFFGWIGHKIGSHLLGAFVAGMSFVKVPRSHQIWTRQLKRIIKWTIRIFFAATVGFAIPVSTMLEREAVINGLLMGLLPGILGKIASGAAARMKYISPEHRSLAASASR